MIEKIREGVVRITFPKGVVDTRDKSRVVHSEAIVMERDAKFFVEAQ